MKKRKIEMNEEIKNKKQKIVSHFTYETMLLIASFIENETFLCILENNFCLFSFVINNFKEFLKTYFKYNYFILYQDRNVLYNYFKNYIENLEIDSWDSSKINYDLITYNKIKKLKIKYSQTFVHKCNKNHIINKILKNEMPNLEYMEILLNCNVKYEVFNNEIVFKNDFPKLRELIVNVGNTFDIEFKTEIESIRKMNLNAYTVYFNNHIFSNLEEIQIKTFSKYYNICIPCNLSDKLKEIKAFGYIQNHLNYVDFLNRNFNLSNYYLYMIDINLLDFFNICEKIREDVEKIYFILETDEINIVEYLDLSTVNEIFKKKEKLEIIKIESKKKFFSYIKE